MSAALALALAVPSAFACGGLVCDAGPGLPVVQNAERIAFAVDADAGTVEAHVQVFYEGPPDEFAWIVPVQGNPEVFLSNDALFDQIGLALEPSFQLDFEMVGECRGGGSAGGCGGVKYGGSEGDRDVDTDGSFDDTDDGVLVVDDGSVGPYDYAVLQADTSIQLTGWLTDAGFPIPDGLDELLVPYLTPDAHFLAVRLSKDVDTGDIAPLGWTYEGDAASIPIQLTAIAAAPDLRLEVSVFGAHRAVPESYLHVRINEAQLNWFDGGSNYYDVISRAADQAGGHAFATDYAGATDVLAGGLWNDFREDQAASLQTAPDEAAMARTLSNMTLRNDGAMRLVFANQGVDLDDFFIGPFLQIDGSFIQDRDLLLADLEQFVFEPLRRAEALFEHRHVTRMSSSLDAVEMTIDPVFVLNPDIEQEVSSIHTATFITECNGKLTEEAPRRLALSDGRNFAVPSILELRESEESLQDYWSSRQSDIDAILIEQTGRSGAAEPILDLTPDAFAAADILDDLLPSDGACGCSPGVSPLSSVGLLSAALGVLFFRRRLES